MKKMKKRTWILLLVCILILAGLASHIDTYRTNGTVSIQTINEVLGVELSEDMILDNRDSHGGLHGDGEAFVIFCLSEEEGEQLQAELENNAYWHVLPMTENMKIAVYGDKQSSTGPLVLDEISGVLFPEAENGYWFFLDRYPGAAAPGEDTKLFSRTSYNFTAALYDLDSRILYYYELDT